jgi:uncharacterized protein YaaN involved in tellurite resistance
MGQKIQLDGKEYDVDEISSKAADIVGKLRFTDAKLTEFNNMVALLTRAKRSYMQHLKKEMLATKAGYLLEDD